MSSDFIVKHITKNVDRIHAMVGPRVQVGMVLKRVYPLISQRNFAVLMKQLQDDGARVDCWFVECMDDAVCARAMGVTGRIMLLYLTLAEDAALAAEHDIELVCPNASWLRRALRYKAERRRCCLKLHLWVDSGLSKEGAVNDAKGEAELVGLARRIAKGGGGGGSSARVVGVGTHFTTADGVRNRRDYIDVQRIRFSEIVQRLRDERLIADDATIHAACTYEVSAMLQDTFYNMVRVGNLALNGVESMPVTVLDIKRLPPNSCVGYWCESGRTDESGGDTRVALVKKTMPGEQEYRYKGKRLRVLNKGGGDPVLLVVGGIRVGSVIQCRPLFSR